MKKGKKGMAEKPPSSSSSARYSGAQYKASGGGGAGGDGGDKQRKGAKFEPFAYLPLDSRAMSGKHGSKSVARFAGVTASTSKGIRSAAKRSAADMPPRPSHGQGGSSGGKRKR